MICPDCQKEFKNLGAHQRFCKGVGIVEDNYIPEKRLSTLVSDMRTLLVSYSHTLEVKTIEESGVTGYVEITARFPIRR